MRATEFFFDCPSTLAATLAQAEGRELALEQSEGLAEGDWILVTVRVAEEATTLAGRVVLREGREAAGSTNAPWFGVEFAEHDWEHLLSFAAAERGPASRPVSRQSPPCSVCPPCDTTVLVVHDDAAVADMLRRMLGNHGFCACWAANPREALETLAATKVDLVLADWMPHGMTGNEFCAELLRQCHGRALRRPPVVFLACPSARADRSAALRAGADDFVVLPFRWRELDARLLSLLHRSVAAS